MRWGSAAGYSLHAAVIPRSTSEERSLLKGSSLLALFWRKAFGSVKDVVEGDSLEVAGGCALSDEPEGGRELWCALFDDNMTARSVKEQISRPNDDERLSMGCSYALCVAMGTI